MNTELEKKLLIYKDISIRINDLQDSINGANSQAAWAIHEILSGCENNPYLALQKAIQSGKDDVYDLVDSMQMYCQCLAEHSNWETEFLDIKNELEGVKVPGKVNRMMDDLLFLEPAVYYGASSIFNSLNGVSTLEVITHVFDAYLQALCKDEDVLEFRITNDLLIPLGVLKGLKIKALSLIVDCNNSYEVRDFNHAVFNKNSLVTEDCTIKEKGGLWMISSNAIVAGCSLIKCLIGRSVSNGQ